MLLEVHGGDGVPDALQAMPDRRVLGAEDHQGAQLGAGHQPIRGIVWDPDRGQTQDGAVVDLLQGQDSVGVSSIIKLSTNVTTLLY